MNHEVIIRTPRLAAAALVLALGASPQVARAAACCTSATSFGIGRLLAWEDAAYGVQLSHARSLGQWDATGSLRWNGGDFSDGLSQVQPWGILKLHDRVQLQAWLPIVVNDRRSGTTSQVAGGLGDAGAAVRLELAKIGEYQGLPSFAVTAGAVAPTGRRVEQTKAPLFAGTTGRGAWGGSLAAEVEYAFLPWFVRVEGGVTAFLPFERTDTGQSQRYGPVAVASASTGLELVPDVLVAAVALMGEWQSSIHLDGARVPDSRAYAYTLGTSMAWRVDPKWSLVWSITNTVWPDGGGMNRDARVGFTMGVRHGVF
jgi:hypothetical protein